MGLNLIILLFIGLYHKIKLSEEPKWELPEMSLCIP